MEKDSIEQGRQFVSPRHLTFAEAGKYEVKILASDRVVIPARNEAESIGSTIGYLMQAGFSPEQIIIMVNHSTDKTAEIAAVFGVTVLHQDVILSAEIVLRLDTEYGIDRSRLKGKGTAMFAACLELARVQTPDDARIFFLDADITNLGEVSPIPLLLAGWEAWNGDIKIIKLASLGRNNEGIIAFLGLPRVPYAGIGALQWPLCGQMSLRWRDLKRMRGATRYAIEMAILMDLLERNETPAVFGEVELHAVLRDKKNNDHDHSVMYRGILAFMAQLLQTGGWKPLHTMQVQQIKDLNKKSGVDHPFWAPPKSGNGAAMFGAYPLDAILPSIQELVAR